MKKQFLKNSIFEKPFMNSRIKTEEMTMKEIGLTLNLSESRVSQMHSSILRRLQDQLGPRRPDLAVNA